MTRESTGTRKAIRLLTSDVKIEPPSGQPLELSASNRTVREMKTVRPKDFSEALRLVLKENPELSMRLAIDAVSKKYPKQYEEYCKELRRA